VVEAENLNVLRQLAKAVNAGAVAAGQPDPKYEAYLEEGNDGRSIDVGFLVKGSRVTVRSAKQLGKNERFSEPGGRSDAFLHDRPPLVIEAEIRDEKSGTPFRVTVMSNHLKSLRGITDERDGPRVRAKRALQAEYIAKWVNERQKADPNERIVIAGDLNAFQFNDGLVDIIGTLTGKPTPKDAVLASSPDLVERDLINLVDLIQISQRYSYVFDGSAQSLDHIIINEPMRKHLNGFGYLRVNADFPKAFRADGERIEGFSDHDVAVAYFSLD
ncbi:MAG TPA: nuclease, partial [Blastocatellia bacterium]|nr:nuclease [Blastocatellia bacterium]